MKIVHRYILAELLRNFAFTFVVLAAIIAMMVFSVLALQSATANLAVGALLQMVGLLCIERLDIVIPLTVLTSTIFTYAHLQSVGELTAMRSAGIGLVKLLLPPLAIGALAMFSLAWLQDEWMPWSHYQRNVIGKRHWAENIASMLQDSNTQIDDRKFKVRWDSTNRDTDGFVVLENVFIAEMGDKTGAPRITRARRAKPTLDPETGNLSLELQSIVRGERISAEEMVVRLNLRDLSEEPPPSRRDDDLSYEELLSDSRRFPDERRGRRMLTTFHGRASNALAAMLFSLLGAGIGIIARTANRAVIFALGFMIVLLFHYGPSIAVSGLSEKGSIPSSTIWVGNVAIAILMLAALRRARHG